MGHETQAKVNVVSGRVIEHFTTVFEVLIYMCPETTEHTMVVHISNWKSDTRIGNVTGAVDKYEIEQGFAGVSNSCGLLN